MNNDLNGAAIVVTRPAAQAERLCRLIEDHGGRALRFPTLEILPVSVEPKAIDHALASDWLIFTSANAVDFALTAFDGKMLGFKSVALAAVGQATARALREAGFDVACQPAHEFSSEGLLAEPIMQKVVGKQITVIRGISGREILAKTLAQRGAKVEYLEVYRRCRPEIDNGELCRQLKDGQVKATTATSCEALDNLLAMLDQTAIASLCKLPLVVVSERIAGLAQQSGFERIKVSRQPSDAAILETLTTLFCGEYSGRSN